MLLRQALLAAILVSGTAAAAAAQSDQFPFRRFGMNHWSMPRFEGRSQRFFMRDNQRFRVGAERLRFRLQQRNHDLASRIRIRASDARGMAMRMRDRGFAMRDQGRGNPMEFQFRGMNRMRDRIRSRMDHFQFRRPMMERYSRPI
jgi:hypothetical protein